MDKVGTNRYLKDKKVAVDFVRPWNILLHYKALEWSGVDGGGTKKEGKEGKIQPFQLRGGTRNPYLSCASQAGNQGHTDFQPAALPRRIQYRP